MARQADQTQRIFNTGFTVGFACSSNGNCQNLNFWFLQQVENGKPIIYCHIRINNDLFHYFTNFHEKNCFRQKGETVVYSCPQRDSFSMVNWMPSGISCTGMPSRQGISAIIQPTAVMVSQLRLTMAQGASPFFFNR